MTTRKLSFAAGAFAIFVLCTSMAFAGGQQLISLDYSQYSGAWTFDDGTSSDVSGNTGPLTGSDGTPTFIANVPSSNGWAASELGGLAFNASGPRLNTPGGIYTGGDFTWTFAARSGAGSNLSFGTILSSQRFQMHQDGQTASGRIDVRNVGTGDFAGADSFSFEDWHLVTMRYNATSGLVEQFITTNTDTLDASPETFNVGSSYTSITSFGLGRDGLSGIGGADAFGGTSQMDFAIFQDGLLTNAQLQDIYTFFVDGAAVVPEPSTFGLASLSLCGLAMVGWRRRRLRLC